MDRNGNADVLPPLKSSTKGNVKAHESNVSGALPLVGGVQVQQLFEEETNQQNKGKVANEIQGLPSVHPGQYLILGMLLQRQEGDLA